MPSTPGDAVSKLGQVRSESRKLRIMLGRNDCGGESPN
jgi:hypothetical protein